MPSRHRKPARILQSPAIQPPVPASGQGGVGLEQHALLRPGDIRVQRNDAARSRVVDAQRSRIGRHRGFEAAAGGIVGAQAAAKAPPDGNHFFFAAIHHAVLPSLKTKLPYDIQKDFVPVGMGARYPIVLVVHPSLPVKSVQELIAYAKANPNKLSYSSAGTGGGTHLAGELFTSLTGVKMQHIPYKGSSPAMQDLVGGQVQLMFADSTSAIPFIKSGRVRALAVGNPEPSVFFPDLPTIASSGVKDYEAYSWSGVVAPKGTPPEAVKQANAQLNKVLKDPQVIETMNKAGQEPVAMTPEEFAAFLDNEIKKWSKTIKSAGIQPE